MEPKDRAPPGVGVALPRVEDPRFLTGDARFTDDIAVADQAYAVMVRSPHPHARIVGIDTSAARAARGVLGVLTAADLAAQGVSPIPSLTGTPPYRLVNTDGSALPDPSQYPLARGTVRYLGEPVAMLVAETLAAARDAAERVHVDYEPLAPVMALEQALADGAPRVWEELTSNVSFEWQDREPEAVGAALARAAHVTRLELINNRVAVAFMEPRAAIGQYDAASGRFTLLAGCQSAHALREMLCAVLGVDAERVRVHVPDTGGGFGARGVVYPEFALVLLAARALGRAVKWTAERGESFLTDTQARDHVLRCALGLDASGRFLALEACVDWRHGPYVPSRNIHTMVRFLPPTMGGVYRIPLARVAIRGVFSNTAPQSAYRGIGRVEATYLLESLVDAAAREMGMDRVEIRRRNLIRPEDLPWRAGGGAVYGSGAFEANMDRALALADWQGFAKRRATAAEGGRLRGIGLAMFIENDGGAPSEFAAVEACADGTFEVSSGTQNFGMGHETVFAQVLADQLGVPLERVRLVQGDTDRVPRGFGSHGSRSARIGGTAVVLGARAMLARATDLAAQLLEVDAADIAYQRGRYTIAGTDRGVSLPELAAYAATLGERLAGEADFRPDREAYSNGCQICELEVDPETGAIALLAHVLVADVGRALNPLVVHGQLHGGLAQGIGQALMEQVVYDPDSAQTLTGSFMDYPIPRADDLPSFVTELNEIAESDNPLGVKGAGEGPTTGAPAAFMSAVRDALGGGACAPDMPATSEPVWRAIRGADVP